MGPGFPMGRISIKAFVRNASSAFQSSLSRTVRSWTFASSMTTLRVTPGRMPTGLGVTSLPFTTRKTFVTEGDLEARRGRLHAGDVVVEPEGDSVVGAQRLEEPAPVQEAAIRCRDRRLALGKELAVQPDGRHRSLMPSARAIADALVRV